MAKVIPAATTSFGGPIASVTTMPTDTLPTGGGGTGVGAGSNLPDTLLAVTLTGRRFFWEARLSWPGNSTTVGMGLSFTGTPRWMFAEIEATVTTGTTSQSLSRSSTSNLTQTTFSSPLVVNAGGNVNAGTVVGRGWIDYATSGTYTLTPVYYNGAASNAYYQRVFRVDTWLA